MDLEKYKKAIREIDKDNQIPEDLFQYCVEALYIANQRVKTKDGKVTHVGLKHNNTIEYTTLDDQEKKEYLMIGDLRLASIQFPRYIKHVSIDICCQPIMGKLCFSYHEMNGNSPEDSNQIYTTLEFDQKYFGLNEI